MRDELLAGELFETLAEAQVMVADWRTDYNERRTRRSDDPETETLTWASAGHPQPILLEDAPDEPLTAVSAPPLGAGVPGAHRQDQPPGTDARARAADRGRALRGQGSGGPARLLRPRARRAATCA